jgi:hypothetical protein
MTEVKEELITISKRDKVYEVKILGDASYNVFSFTQLISLDSDILDTFWKRIKWLFSGKF